MSKRLAMSERLSRREIEELLPWYAAGTLDAAERAQVEAALVGDADLSAKLALTREEMHETILDVESSGAPDPQAWTRLRARIEAEPRRRTSGAVLRDLMRRFLDWTATPRLGLAAAMLVVAAGSGVVAAQFLRERPGRFVVASSNDAAKAGRFALVAFQPGATAEAISTLLDERRIAIVDGPMPGGLYRLRLGPSDMTIEESDHVLAALKASGVVRTAARGG